ncbi:MAG TPA: hypothetical protein VMZ53_20055 [Kofleriaceae bacterium]|nr:hypothetical protein [Kofleriaceae bacterium]
MSKWLTLAAVLCACQSKNTDKPAKPATGSGSGSIEVVATGSGSAKDPWVTVDAAPVTPESKRKAAEAAVSRVESIEPKLAKLRELPLKKEVPAAYQTTDDFRAFLKRDIDKELPPKKSKDMGDALLHIGLLDKPVDLADTLIKTMVTQAAAYYDPAQKKFFVVMAPDNEMLLDTMSAHELTHALQDQHFDLAKYLPSGLDDDQTNARHFVVEGDATFAMLVYTSASGGSASKETTNLLMNLVKTQVEAMAAMDISAFADQMKQQANAFGQMDDDMRKSMESIGELPLAIIGPLIDSYMKGAVLCMAAYEHGGWKGVDDLYKNPPESTEQVLHPSTKMYPTREHPRAITLPKMEGTEVETNVMGELQWSNYFQVWKLKVPDAAPGWGGDKFSVTRDKDGHLLGVLVSAWDSEADAKQFVDAYVQALAARFPGAKGDALKDGLPRPDFGKVFVRQVGDRVYIVDGAADVKVLDRVVKDAKVAPAKK